MKKNNKANFKWKPFSRKQLKIMTWWNKNSPVKDYDGIIADGAVRSGKTIAMAPSFVMWAMENFDECDFAICGKTIGSLNRNVINTLKKQGYQAYFVGGCVRDLLLGQEVKDYDITTNATPEQIAETFGNTVTCGNNFLVSIVDGIVMKIKYGQML